MIARRVLVSGRVQGVWYRDSCRREAERLGVRGSARNLPDGRVEVVAAGEEAAVEALIDWCRIGPPAAAVVNVEAQEVPVDGIDGERFRIR